MISNATIERLIDFCDETEATLDAFMAEPAAAHGGVVIATFRSGQYAAERVTTDPHTGKTVGAEYIACDDLKEALAAMDDLAHRSDRSKA